MELRESYSELIQACKGEPEDLDIIKEYMLSFKEYVSAVFNEAVMLPIIRLRYDEDELVSRTKSLDTARNNVHNLAISACSVLNRLCRNKGLEPFCPDPEKSDRYKIGDFCAMVTVDFFSWGTHRESLDELIKELLEMRRKEQA